MDIGRGGVVFVVWWISVSVRIVSIVSVMVGEEGRIVSDVEGGQAFDIDHFSDRDFVTLECQAWKNGPRERERRRRTLS